MHVVESAFTEWREERLYVLRMIEDLKAEQRRQSEAAAIAKVNVEDKAQRDIKAAHDKIRALETSGTVLSVKNWIMVAALSIAAGVGMEVLRAWLGK